jgi:hypothetical protein
MIAGETRWLNNFHPQSGRGNETALQLELPGSNVPKIGAMSTLKTIILP